MSGLEDWQNPSAVNKIAGWEMPVSSPKPYDQESTDIWRDLYRSPISLDDASRRLVTASLTHVAQMLSEREHAGILTETSPDYLDIVLELERKLQCDWQQIPGLEPGAQIQASGEIFIAYDETPLSRQRSLSFDPLYADERITGSVKSVRVLPIPQEIERRDLHAYFKNERDGIAGERPEPLPLNPWGVGLEIHEPAMVHITGNEPIDRPTAIIPLNYSHQLHRIYPSEL